MSCGRTTHDAAPGEADAAGLGVGDADGEVGFDELPLPHPSTPAARVPMKRTTSRLVWSGASSVVFMACACAFVCNACSFTTGRNR